MAFAGVPRPSIVGLLGLALVVASGPAAGEELVRIGGTGMALAAMRLAADSLRPVESDIRVEVMPSLGTPGGLQALASGAVDIAVAGRRLTDAERAAGLVQVGCTVTPLVFASSHPAPGGIRLADLSRLYADPSPTWPDGGPLKVLLRSRAGSENAYLAAVVPDIQAALDKAYGRSGVPIATTDQDNAELAQRVRGSFALMTLLQHRAERLDLRILTVDGVAPEPVAVAEGRYPLSVTVCLVLPARPLPAAAKLVAHLRTETGRVLLGSLGATPIE